MMLACDPSRWHPCHFTRLGLLRKCLYQTLLEIVLNTPHNSQHAPAPFLLDGNRYPTLELLILALVVAVHLWQQKRGGKS